MNTFREKMKQTGYDAEDAYFHKREQELIQKMRDGAAKAKTNLVLLKGGKSEDTLLLPAGRSIKKAA